MYTGIDLSLSNTGLIIIDEEGNIVLEKSIKTPPTKEKTTVNTIKRVQGINDTIMNYLLRQNVRKVAIEGFSYGSKGSALFQIAYLGYRLRESLLANDIDFIEPTPGQLKQFATGKGNTKKSEIMLQVYKKWSKEFSDDNLADAYVLAQILKGLENENGLNKIQLGVLGKIKR